MTKTCPSPEWADEKFVTATRGITHTPLFNLRKAGKIRSLSLKVDGAKYGKRLYHIPSIDAFLASLEASEIGGTDNSTAAPSKIDRSGSANEEGRRK